MAWFDASGRQHRQKRKGDYRALYGQMNICQPLVAALLPTHIPRNDAMIDSTHPPQMSIQKDVTQKVGSTIAEIMPRALHIDRIIVYLTLPNNLIVYQ